jgi:hypothetical protein
MKSPVSELPRRGRSARVLVSLFIFQSIASTAPTCAYAEIPTVRSPGLGCNNFIVLVATRPSKFKHRIARHLRTGVRQKGHQPPRIQLRKGPRSSPGFSRCRSCSSVTERRSLAVPAGQKRQVSVTALPQSNGAVLHDVNAYQSPGGVNAQTQSTQL